MTFAKTEKAVSFIGMKHSNSACLGGGVVVAFKPLAVIAGDANACQHNAETVEQTSTERSQKTDEKTEIELANG